MSAGNEGPSQWGKSKLTLWDSVGRVGTLGQWAFCHTQEGIQESMLLISARDTEAQRSWDWAEVRKRDGEGRLP